MCPTGYEAVQGEGVVHGATAVGPKEIDSSARISLPTIVVLLRHILPLWKREMATEHEMFPNAVDGEPRGMPAVVYVYHHSGLSSSGNH